MFDWQQERHALKQDIHKELRELKDRELVSTFYGSEKIDITLLISDAINAGSLATSTVTTFGPFYFDTEFTKPPAITFGQIPADQKNLVTLLPFVYKWEISSGYIQGFTMGAQMLALPTIGATGSKTPNIPNTHTVTWIAMGHTTRYRSGKVGENWSSSYDLSARSHLEVQNRDIDT